MKPATQTLLALIAIQILFGINYTVSKIILEYMPPLVWASLRVTVATVVLMSVSFVAKRKHPKLEKVFFMPLIGFALLGCIINQGSFIIGLKYTTATNSAILNTLIPIFTLLIVAILGHEKLTGRQICGFLSAFVGVLVLRHIEDMSFSDETFIGDLLNIVNALSYATFLAVSKKFMEKYDRLWTTAWMFFFGSIGLGMLSVPSWVDFQIPAFTNQLVFALLYAIVGGTILTYFLNIWTLARTKSSSVAIFIYLQPLVAIPIAWYYFDEVPTLRTWLSILLIFAGMLLALKEKRQPKTSA